MFRAGSGVAPFTRDGSTLPSTLTSGDCRVGAMGVSRHVFQIHGQGLSRNYLQNYLVVSGIEALPATRF